MSEQSTHEVRAFIDILEDQDWSLHKLEIFIRAMEACASEVDGLDLLFELLWRCHALAKDIDARNEDMLRRAYKEGGAI